MFNTSFFTADLATLTLFSMSNMKENIMEKNYFENTFASSFPPTGCFKWIVLILLNCFYVLENDLSQTCLSHYGG